MARVVPPPPTIAIATSNCDHPLPETPFCESFNGKFRGGRLDEHWFTTLQEAKDIVEAWRREYNEERPHSSLNDWTPVETIQYLLDEATRGAADSRCLAEARSSV